MENTCATIRQRAFAKRLPYDGELARMARTAMSHRFLVNPASQNTYLYQVEFVQAFSELYFRKPISQLSFLDWGCGKGHVSFLLKSRGANVTSCDYRSAVDLDEDSAFGQVTPVIASSGIQVERLEDAIRLPYSDGRFDAVLSFGVLEHVHDDLGSLQELHRILKYGGAFFCFNLPYYLSWGQRMARLVGNSYHDRLYDKARVQELLSKSRFRLIDLWHRQLFPKNRVRYPFYRFFETLDQSLVGFTLLKHLATNIEFVAAA